MQGTVQAAGASKGGSAKKTASKGTKPATVVQVNGSYFPPDLQKALKPGYAVADVHTAIASELKLRSVKSLEALKGRERFEAVNNIADAVTAKSKPQATAAATEKKPAAEKKAPTPKKEAAVKTQLVLKDPPKTGNERVDKARKAFVDSARIVEGVFAAGARYNAKYLLPHEPLGVARKKMWSEATTTLDCTEAEAKAMILGVQETISK